LPKQTSWVRDVTACSVCHGLFKLGTGGAGSGHGATARPPPLTARVAAWWIMHTRTLPVTSRPVPGGCLRRSERRVSRLLDAAGRRSLARLVAPAAVSWIIQAAHMRDGGNQRSGGACIRGADLPRRSARARLGWDTPAGPPGGPRRAATVALRKFAASRAFGLDASLILCPFGEIRDDVCSSKSEYVVDGVCES